MLFVCFRFLCKRGGREGSGEKCGCFVILGFRKGENKRIVWVGFFFRVLSFCLVFVWGWMEWIREGRGRGRFENRGLFLVFVFVFFYLIFF